MSSDFTVTASATDDTRVQSVELRLGGRTLATFMAPPYRFGWTIAGQPCGASSLSAIATDAAGNQSTASVSFFSTKDPCDKDCDGLRATGPCGGNDCNDTDPSIGATIWTSETLATPFKGEFGSIAIDGMGQARVAYTDDRVGSLLYHTGTTAASNDRVLDSEPNISGNVFSWNRIALDAGGSAHISYRDLGKHSLKYATDASGSWVAETVDSEGDPGDYNQIALDLSGTPHIAYSGGQGVRFASRTATGTWRRVPIAQTAMVATYAALAIDQSGAPHVAFFDPSGAVEHATLLAGAWQIEVADPRGGGGCSIALDAAGAPHISYSRNDVEVWIATRSATGWTQVQAGSGGVPTTLRIDASGRSHLVYGAGTRGAWSLVYSTDLSGAWVETTLGTSNDQNLGLSHLALTGAGWPYVVHNLRQNMVTGEQSDLELLWLHACR
jgi:hypothetical protein